MIPVLPDFQPIDPMIGAPAQGAGTAVAKPPAVATTPPNPFLNLPDIGTGQGPGQGSAFSPPNPMGGGDAPPINTGGAQVGFAPNIPTPPDLFTLPGTGTQPPAPPSPAGVTPFGPGNSLVGQTITPTNVAAPAAVGSGTAIDPTTLTTQQAGLATKVAGTDRGAMSQDLQSSEIARLAPGSVTAPTEIGTGPSARLAGQQAATDAAAAQVGAIDPVQLAMQEFNTFNQGTDPAYQASIREAESAGVAQGMGNSGGLRTSIGNLALARGNALDTEKQSLLENALQTSIGESFQKEQALQGLSGQTAGEEAAARGQTIGQRQFATGVDTGNVDRSLGAKEAGAQLGSGEASANVDAGQRALSLITGAQGQAAGEAAGQRGEQRTDQQLATNIAGQNIDRANALLQQQQGYQAGQNEQSIQNAAQEAALEDSLTTSQQDRSLALLAAGEQGNPANTLASIAQQFNFDPAVLAQLAQSLGGQSAGG